MLTGCFYIFRRFSNVEKLYYKVKYTEQSQIFFCESQYSPTLHRIIYVQSDVTCLSVTRKTNVLYIIEPFYILSLWLSLIKLSVLWRIYVKVLWSPQYPVWCHRLVVFVWKKKLLMWPITGEHCLQLVVLLFKQYRVCCVVIPMLQKDSCFLCYVVGIFSHCLCLYLLVFLPKGKTLHVCLAQEWIFVSLTYSQTQGVDV